MKKKIIKIREKNTKKVLKNDVITVTFILFFNIFQHFFILVRYFTGNTHIHYTFYWLDQKKKKKNTIHSLTTFL